MLLKLACTILVVSTLAGLVVARSALTTYACGQPSEAAIAAAFDLASVGVVTAGDQQGNTVAQALVPSSLLKAVGWVESGWRQFSASGHPLVSFDFGYGIMQITSGMAGAFGSPTGTLDAGVQNRIASDYRFNIAYGAYMLALKRASTPTVGDANPSEIETWYYALWAYNGWGWVNNPNNPRFSREGNPATDPASFPYQERVLYWVAHPPRDAAGNYLWQPISITLPSAKGIGRKPGPLLLPKTHSEPSPTLSAVYQTPNLQRAVPNTIVSENVRVTNTGIGVWTDTGDSAIALTYDLLAGTNTSLTSLSPFSPGVLEFGQGRVPLPKALLPGQTVVVPEQVKVPETPGSYRLAWDLVQGVDALFSQAGVVPHLQMLRVQPSSTPVSTPSPTPTPPRQSENLQFLADTGMSDGTAVDVGAPFTKAWLVYNNGQTAWKAGWRLVHLTGPTFGAKSIAVPATSPCQIANILAVMRAPRTAGSLRGVWQMEDPSGKRFGEKLTVVIDVGHNTVTPRPTPAPTKTPIRRTPVPSTPTPSG